MRAALILLVAALTACGLTPSAPATLADGVLPDGTLYQGNLRNSRLHGEGWLKFANGDEYRGEFDQGLMHGQGVYTYQNGDVLTGQFKAGAPVRGVSVSGSRRYEGEFADWEFHGHGELYDSERNLLFRGQFVEGDFTGTGTMMEDGELRYRGEFRNWLFHGNGVLLFSNGERVEGQFEHHVLVGDVTLIRQILGGKETRQHGRMEGRSFVPADEQSPRQRMEALVEQILAQDGERLREALAEVAPERPGVQDLYYLVLGGDGDDSVFTRDVIAVKASAAFHSREYGPVRGVVLLNDRSYADYPLATRRSLEQALTHITGVMNLQEDVLLIHLSSHGAEDGELRIAQPGMLLPNLSPAWFRDLLERVPVPHLVLVVSACHSGHWLDTLATDHNMILVSARRDRTSFGCGDDSEMTWFTRALYDDGDFALHDPESLFSRVRARIQTWEDEQGIGEDKRSQPQFHLGKRFIGVAVPPIP